MITQQSSQPVQKQAHDELILVVKRTTLFPHTAWQGLQQVDYGLYTQLIRTHQEFHPRSIMENDQIYKQIIPYLVFAHEDRYFLMQRQAKASETRLQNKFSLGIGGHINEIDITDGDIASWARREFDEEVSYDGTYTLEPLGILNDDSNAVGQVHIGFVYILRGNSPHIAIKDEHKSGFLVTLEEGEQYFETMETWSQIVFNFIKSK